MAAHGIFDDLSLLGQPINALDRGKGADGNAGAIFPLSDADDFGRGARFIPGEVTEARRAGQRATFVTACGPCCWYWEMPDGTRIFHCMQHADSLAALLAELGFTGPFLDLNDLTSNPGKPFPRIPLEDLDAAIHAAGKPFGLLLDGRDGVSSVFHTANGTRFTLRSAAFESNIIITLETPGSGSQFALTRHTISELRRMLAAEK